MSLLGCLLVAACSQPPALHAPSEIGAWLVYWDGGRGLAELERHGALFDQVSLFAYELDPAGLPRPAPGMEALKSGFLALARERGFAPWVTVVNDTRQDNGRVTLKDAALVQRLLTDPATREQHALALAARVATDGFAGLHLDYESIAPTYETQFQDFVVKLSGALRDRGLALNVVVEPRRSPLPPPGAATLTVMGYNQHGPHGTAGPRATPRFVAGLADRTRGDMQHSPALALAVGGFRWTPPGPVEPLDWEVGHRLADSTPTVSRGLFTRVPHFRLADGSDVWFDDTESLGAKWEAAYAAGFRRLMLWRLGGNDQRLFDWVGALHGARVASDNERGSGR